MKVKIFFAVFILVAFCLFSFEILWAQDIDNDTENVPYWWKGQNFTGEIIKVDKDRIVVNNRENVKREFVIDSQTKIFLRESEKMDPGMFVKIIYKETKQINIAKAIREIRKPQ